MSSIREVAKLAGVGIGTVSRVFNNSGYVSEETRKKVEDAIQKLNYSPNAMAKSLLKSNSNNIALILPTIHHPLFSRFAYVVEKTLNRSGFNLILCNSDFEVQKELEYINMLNQKIIDGIIFISNSDINDCIPKNLPIVTIDRHLSNEMVFISSDNYEGGRLAALHLIKKGCEKLAFVGGFPKVQTEVHKRKLGFIEILEEESKDYVIYEESDVILDEVEFVNGFIKKHSDDVDGIFALTDMQAYSLIKHLKEKGIRVPEDVKVVGYDGIQVIETLTNGLTTIKQPIDEMGELAAKSITKMVQREKVEKECILPVTLIKGTTT